MGVSLGSFFLRLLFILVAGTVMIYLTNRHVANTYFAQFGAPTGNNVNGVWIGILDTFDYPVPADELEMFPESAKQKPVKKRAAILLNLRLTDATMGTYQGSGSFCIQGATGSRNITYVEFDIDKGAIDGQIRADEDGSQRDGFLGAHSLAGTMQGSVMAVSDLKFRDYGYRGQLQHGDVSGYQQLCKSLELQRVSAEE